MNSHSLRTKAALELAPWLQEPGPYVREWKIPVSPNATAETRRDLERLSVNGAP